MGLLRRRLGHRSIDCHSLHDIAIDTIDRSISALAQPRGILGDGIQHWLNIRRRAGDHAQYFTRRCLLLQALRVEFLEQPHVLDGDHAWSAKVLSSSICLSVKGRTSVAPNHDRPDGDAFA